MKKLNRSTVAIAMVLLAVTQTKAIPLYINGSLATGMTLTVEAGNALNIASSGFGGSANYGPDDGNVYSGPVAFGAMNFTTGAFVPLNAFGYGYWPGSGTESFVYQDNSSPDALDMNITWTVLLSGGEVELVGTGIITASSGSASFEANYPLNGTVSLQAYFPTVPADYFYNGPAGSVGTPIVAEFEGAEGDPVPEGGATAGLLGLAFLGIAALRRSMVRIA